MNILIAGCGYVGLPLGVLLKSKGHNLSGWVFSGKSALQVSAAGLDPIMADLADAGSWKKFQQSFDAIVYCPSTRGGTSEDYRRIYVEGLQKALGGLKPGGRFLYTGSTSVYGQDDGSLVDERSLTEPGTESGKILLEAESLALSAGGTVLRLGALYGPGRGMILKRFLESDGTMTGNPGHYLNQLHREDAVSAAAFLLDHPVPGREMFNGCDNHPATRREIVQWLADTLKKIMPDFGGEETSSKRGSNNRRISNAKLLGLGWVPNYPSYREGYLSLLSAPATGL